MKQVRIANLKAHLSRYLREVRRGHGIVVLDRETPIARVIPYSERKPTLVIQHPQKKARLGEIKLPPPPRESFDVLTYLWEERQLNR